MHAVVFNQKGKDLQSKLCVFSLRMLNCFDMFLRVNNCFSPILSLVMVWINMVKAGGADGYLKCFAATFILRPSCLVFPILHSAQ